MAVGVEARTLRCSFCQEENPAAAKFCLGCGARVRRTCARCKTELPGHARFCFECGHPTETSSAQHPDSTSSPPTPSDETASPPAARMAPVIVERPAVLNAFYHQGLDALGRGDHSTALAALAPVVKELPNAYPDARALLDEALRGLGTNVTPAAEASGTDRHRVLGKRVRRTVLSVRPPADTASWRSRGRALLETVGQVLPTATWKWLDPTYSRLRAANRKHPFFVWGLTALAIAFVVIGLWLSRGSPSSPRTASSTEEAGVATAVPDAELFARCDESVTAERWSDAISTCRIARARAPDREDLPEKLATAYVGRGNQRLDDGDLRSAAADFEQALTYQPESIAAQSAWRQLSLYQEGDKALGTGQWDVAVAQLSAAYAEAPDYLRQLGERSLEGKLFTAWLKWGQSAFNAEDYPTAVARCSQALALVHDDAEAQACITASTPTNELAQDAGQ